MENSYKYQAEEPVKAAPEASPAPAEKKKWKFFLLQPDKYLRYVVFLVVIGLVYVWNSNMAEKQVRREQELKKAIGEAKARFKTIHARFSNDSRKSVVASRVDTTLNLKPLKEPPYKIVKKKVK